MRGKSTGNHRNSVLRIHVFQSVNERRESTDFQVGIKGIESGIMVLSLDSFLFLSIVYFFNDVILKTFEVIFFNDKPS